MSKIFIIIIITEDNDCDIMTIQVIILVKVDEPDGSIKGKHKLVDNCFLKNLKSKVKSTLIVIEIKCIKLT